MQLAMGKINTRDFSVATGTRSRENNRQIVLNLIRDRQPISRADLARYMRVTRSVVGVLVQELIAQGVICEGATGEPSRGRKANFLHLRTRDRLAIAVDVRFTKTCLMLCDLSGRQLAVENYDTIFHVTEFVNDLAARIRRILKIQNSGLACEGIGIVVPGMVNHRTGEILNAPSLGWQGVEIRAKLAAATGLPVHVEDSGRACALAQLWFEPHEALDDHSFVYISVSDGVSVGIVVNGELLHGRDDFASEFRHLPLNLEGPNICDAPGCWEPYISNLATLSRYFGWHLSKPGAQTFREKKAQAFTVLDLVARAHSGDKKAVVALQATGRFLGLGLAAIVKVVNPDCIYLAGEITTAWDLIENSVRDAMSERTLKAAAARTPLRVTSNQDYPRLRGAAALIAARTFAAPRVA